MSQRTYAIGDVHGQLSKLLRVHEYIAADMDRHGDADSLVVHLGDYADRGPDVPGVIEFLIAGHSAGKPWVSLKGNHDRFMYLFLQEEMQGDPRRPDLNWLNSNIGGRESLAAYGVDVSWNRPDPEIHAEALTKVPRAHVDFLQNLPVFLTRGNAFYVHAGVKPGIPLDQQTEDDMVWIRDPFLTNNASYGPLIVHGHTVVERPLHLGNRLALDTGAGYGYPLTCAVLEEDGSVFHLTAEGRTPLLPIGKAA